MTNDYDEFYLSKWYIDVIDNQTGDLTIIYLAELKWKFVRIFFTNLLRFVERVRLTSTIKYSRTNVTPNFNEKSLTLDLPALVSGDWNSDSEMLREILLNDDEGFILWECWMPKAIAKIQLDSGEQNGLGYVERLTSNMKPWKIPIDILRWGRFLSNDHHIVWIRWHGPVEKILIFHNHYKYTDGVIDDEMLTFSNYKLALSDKSSMRSGPVLKTIFGKYSWIKSIIPGDLIGLDEQKWQTWCVLYQDEQQIAQGWSVHEVVHWKSGNHLFGKFLYGTLFILIIPFLLTIWTKNTENFIDLPVPKYISVGILLSITGFILMILGMLELWTKGNGLPMNAYPPSNFVSTGVYRLFSHPIYVGSSFIAFGLAIYYQSSSGFWLVSPIFTLLWLSLIYGYENDEIKRRFPDFCLEPIFSAPKNDDEYLNYLDLIKVYCLIFLPWLILYNLIILIGVPRHPISTYFSFEQDIPVIEWTEIFYLCAYPYTFLVPWIFRTRHELYVYFVTSFIHVSTGIYIQFFLPFIAEPKDFIPQTVFGRMLLEERKLDGATGAFPSFHVSWIWISTYFYINRYSRHKYVFYMISILLIISVITTGMHSIIDVVGGCILGCICVEIEFLWNSIRHMMEYIGNSWSSFRIGPLRIINHSLYSFLSISTGFFLLCCLLPTTWLIFWISFSSLLSAGIWGQIIEGSSKLSRPFGYFGCIFGGILASLICSYYFHVPKIWILATCSLVGPLIQGLGRLRCLVQGCCHGKPTDNRFIGISIHNPNSRVCSLSHLDNIPLHPTNFYSFCSNLVIGTILWRLWYSNVDLSLIAGLYFILIGISRFVEEAFRGEVQTSIYCGLKVYQWLSIAFICIGISISMIEWNGSDENLNFQPSVDDIVPSILFGVFTSFATGVDFPESNIRFSRLTI